MLGNRKRCLVLVCLATLVGLALTQVEAIKFPEIKLGGKDALGKLLKGAGIVLLIKQFGGELNKFINGVFQNKGAANRDATKVVPILTFGQGIEAGACQVLGPADAVKTVEVVFAVAATLDKGHRFNVQALIPSSTMKGINRVYGVGVSAIIDYRL